MGYLFLLLYFPAVFPILYAIMAHIKIIRKDMFTTNVVISNGADVVASIPVEYGVVFSTFIGAISLAITLIVMSYRYGVKVGETQGHDLGYKAGYKKGFTEGKYNFRKSTKIVDNVICRNHPNKQPLTNGICLIKTNDGTIVDVECPYIEKDKICQLTSDKCSKL